MGIPSEMRDAWINRRKSLLIPSPYEEEKIAASRRCTQEGVRAGTKAAAIACVVTTVPTGHYPGQVRWPLPMCGPGMVEFGNDRNLQHFLQKVAAPKTQTRGFAVAP
ncbi:uncharacterized protein LOC122068219 isoform X3 [Macadamia integrifolia]|uniref:uncharacterized protein LOC122068219 isoform X3 n=1 Tax=Macadamia integrifolia TaxID=60698 RepID=UPI001C4F9F93|nr:uncharacterized protein LOC122068219 isoform X3 [Macadamia integrifolia]